MKQLKTINAYGDFFIIDVKLKEFRNLDLTKTIKFGSYRGEELLTKCIHKKILNDDEINRCF